MYFQATHCLRCLSSSSARRSGSSVAIAAAMRLVRLTVIRIVDYMERFFAHASGTELAELRIERLGCPDGVEAQQAAMRGVVDAHKAHDAPSGRLEGFFAHGEARK